MLLELCWIIHPEGLSLGKAATGHSSRVFPGKTYPQFIPRQTEKSRLGVGILSLPCWWW